MTARLVLCLVLLSSMLIARPVVAQSPYFNEFIDHAKFVRLPPQEQRDFLLALMQTVADMEQKAIQAGQQQAPAEEEKTVHQRRWEQVKKALESFTRQLSLENAYAQAAPPYAQTCFSPGQSSAQPVRENGQVVTCLFGSYRSSYVRSGTTTYCQRPGCSINPEVRAEYARIASLGGCNKQQMACNPALFGYDNSGTRNQKPTCVQLDVQVGGSRVNSVHNASLSCLIAVTNDENSTQRLDNIATAIKNSRATAEEFNKLLHSITNLCICDGEVGTDADVPAYLRDMSNSYSQYISDHRTCNALLSQTSLVLQKVAAQGGGRCISALLPENITNLSQDLSFINNFSSHFHKLARGGSGDATQRLTPAQINSALVQYRSRWVVTAETQVTGNDVRRVAADEALDNVAEYITASNALKARSDTNANRWCPLRFPDPEVPRTAVTCTISDTTATRAEDDKVTVTAKVNFAGLAEGVTPSGIVWKANGAVVEGQAGLELAAENLEGIAADAANVPVEATYTPEGGQPVTCQGTAAFAAAAEEPACAISIGDLTAHTGGKYKATVTATFTVINPDAIAWTPNEVASGTAAAVDRSREVIFNAPTGDTREVSVSIIATTGTQRAECRATKALPAAAETASCNLEISAVLRDDGKYSVRASLAGTTATTEPEGEPTYTGFTFTTANRIGMATVATTNAVQNQVITATYTGKDGKSYSCTRSAVIPATAAPAPSGGGVAPQQPGPMVIPPAGQSLFKPGLR